MSRPKPASAVNLDALTGNLATLRAIAGDEMCSEAMLLLRADLELTPHKLMLMLKRAVAPDAIILKGDEAELRGVHHDTLKGHKDRRELPPLINGVLDTRQ